MTSRIRSVLLWLLPAIAVALAVARVSVWVQPHFAPLVLFPLFMGVALGALLCGLLQLADVRAFWWAIAGAVLIGLLSVAAEHAFFYWDRRNEHLRQAMEKGVPEDVVSTTTFVDYMRAEAVADAAKPALWIGNALLSVGATCGMVVWYLKSRDNELRASVEGRSQDRTLPGEKEIGAS